MICAGQLGLDAVGAPFKDLPAPLKTLGTLCLLGPTAYLFVDIWRDDGMFESCLLYTSPSPRDGLLSRMPSSA